MDVLSSVGGLTSPLAMIIVGASLAMMDIKEMFGDIKVYIYTIIRQIALPLLSWPVIDRFIENDVVATVTLIMTAMPVANTAVLFATEYGCGERGCKGYFSYDACGDCINTCRNVGVRKLNCY